MGAIKIISWGIVAIAASIVLYYAGQMIIPQLVDAALKLASELIQKYVFKLG